VLAEDQPDELAHLYREADARGEQWRRALTGGANRMARDVKDMMDAVLAQYVGDT
jgi:hypothetical protein